jgi:hypothetical protein
LKYSQLIQILAINPRRPAIRRFAAALGFRVNRQRRRQNAVTARAGGAKAGFAASKPGHRGAPRFTRR